MAVFEEASPSSTSARYSDENITRIIFLNTENKYNTLIEEFQRPRSGQKSLCQAAQVEPDRRRIGWQLRRFAA
jgi:hypothetical protein